MATLDFTLGTDQVQAEIIKEDSTNTDILNITVPFSTSISPADIVNYYLADGTKIFSGIVQSVEKAGEKTAIVYDFGAELLQRTVNEIFTNQSPEAIIEYIINNYTSLTYSSSISSGVTIGTYVANKKKAWDIVTELSEVLLANFRVDVDKNFILELEGDTTSSKVIKTGQNGNAVIDGAWTEDKSKLVNVVTVDGDDRQIFEREPETFSGDGTTTEFTLAEVPVNVKVEHPIGTVLKGYVEGSTDGDYRIDRENRKIIFDTAPASGTDNIQVTYDVSIPITITRRNKASIDTYNEHDKTFKKPYIKSRDNARELAQFLINQFAFPLNKATFFITSTSEINDFNNWIPNQEIFVEDPVFNESGYYIIRKVEWNSNGEMSVKVGDSDDDFISWSKEAQQRIKQLEEKDDNSTILSDDEYIQENIRVTFSTEIVFIKTRSKGDAWILDDPVNSQLDKNFKLDGGSLTQLYP